MKLKNRNRIKTPKWVFDSYFKNSKIAAMQVKSMRATSLGVQNKLKAARTNKNKAENRFYRLKPKREKEQARERETRETKMNGRAKLKGMVPLGFQTNPTKPHLVVLTFFQESQRNHEFRCVVSYGITI